MTVTWADVGLKKTARQLRDLWAHSDIKSHSPSYSTTVLGHGVVMLRVK